MSRQLGSVIPISEQYRDDVDESAVVELVQSIFGETSFDQIAKAQATMPHVARRILELEAIVWRLSEQVAFDHSGAHPLVEQAKYILKNRLEVMESGINYEEAEIPPLEPEST